MPDIARPAHGFAIAMRRFGESLIGKDLPDAVSWQIEPPTPHDLRGGHHLNWDDVTEVAERLVVD